MQDDSFRSYLCRYVIIRILVFVQNWTKFLMCVSSMFVSFLLMSLAPLQTITVSSLLRLPISLSANGVMVSFLASRHYVLVTSYEFSIKFAVAEAQSQARLSPITIIFFFFYLAYQEHVFSIFYCCSGGCCCCSISASLLTLSSIA